MRKYWITAGMAATAFMGDSPLFLLDYVLRFLRVAVLLSLWRVLLTGREEVDGMTLGAVLTYTWAAEVFREQLECRTELPMALWDGGIATRLLRPMGLVAQFAADMFGRWGLGFCAFSLPLALCAPLLGVSPLPASPAAALLFPTSLALGVSVGLALEFAFGALMIAYEQNVYTFGSVRRALTSLLSGALLPLAILPWDLGRVFQWLPFAATASAPLRIYTGTEEPLPLLAMQAGWSLALWPLAGWLWRTHRERLACHGG